ncbi:MAG: peptidoglycan DD-metalloendopeptidase family protein [Parafilimonas sp.]
MIKKSLLSFILLMLFLAGSTQETKEEIQKKQQQLQKELTELNKTLSQIKASKKQSLGQLSLVQRKIAARQELINSINKEVKRLSNEIYTNSLEIYRLKKELDTLKLNYSKSLVFAYKNRSNYDYLNFIFSATSFNDAVKRVAYLKSYRQYRETQVTAIEQTENLMQQKITQFASSKTEKNTVLKTQGNQLLDLEKDKKEKDHVVQQLKGQEKNIAAQIKVNEKNRIKLKAALQTIIKREIDAAKKKAEADRIAKLKEDASKNKVAENNTNKSNNANTNDAIASAPKKKERTYSALESTDESLSQSINFETNRGNLPWPVSSGYVSTHFGRYNVPGTGLTGDMPGIEISMPTGTNVKAVADGVVSAVFDMGDGQAVVVRHGKYFTTYSHLSGINVSRGQEINAGTLLGKASAGYDGDGQIIFMVTNEKNVNLNPEGWLKGR